VGNENTNTATSFVVMVSYYQPQAFHCILHALKMELQTNYARNKWHTPAWIKINNK
jgi:hypothetical protein